MTLATILSRRSIRHFQEQAVDAADLDAIPAIHPHAAMTGEVSLAIVICGDLGGARYPDFWIQDCAATENLLPAAHFLVLGAVWCGRIPQF